MFMTEKACSNCKTTKPLDDFHKRSAAADGRTAMCKVCALAKSQAWRDANPEQIRELWRKAGKKYQHNRRLRTYGLNQDEYDALLEWSGGMCELCGLKEGTCIDHDHSTEEVRGLLCNSCNSGLGLLGDTQARLEQAIDYLARRSSAVGGTPLS